MTYQSKIKLPEGVSAWANDGTPPPSWVAEAIVGEKEPNGTFIIATPLGNARVHKGSVVISDGKSKWARPCDELSELLSELSSQPQISAIGPGKCAQFGTTSKLQAGSKKRVMAFRPPIGAMPSIEWVHISDLSVDDSYQRSIENASSRRLIASIAANFDWRLCAPLMVSRRPDGTKVIIDGQHRWAAALRRGDLLQLPCCLFVYGSAEDEARMFIVANRARKPMNRLDDFHAALAAADEDAMEINRLVNEAGLSIARSTSSQSWQPGEIAFTSSIAVALRRNGEKVVSDVLRAMASVFSESVITQGASLFRASTVLLTDPPKHCGPAELRKALASRNMEEWTAVVKGLNGGDEREQAVLCALKTYYVR